MTDRNDRAPDSQNDEDAELRALLRRALSQDDPTPPRDLLRGVQQRIHRRSRGKFYRDGWSRTTGPSSVYLVTSLLMLALLVVLYVVLVPTR